MRQVRILRTLARILLYVVLVVAVLGALVYLQRAELLRWFFDLPPYETARGDDFTLRVPMHDGIKLATHVYLPEGDGPWPTVLIRDPYSMAAHRPAVESNARFLGGEKQWYHDYLTHPDKSDEYWDSPIYAAIRNAHKGARMPVLLTARWHDFFLDGQFKVFEELPRRSESLLVIRNGSHASVGSLAQFRQMVHDSSILALDWGRRHLKGQTVATLPEPGYLLHSNADNSRSHFATWPADSVVQTYSLGSLKGSKSCDGGTLLEQESVAGDSVSYDYDPANPVPSRGGSYSLAGPGVVDQGSDLCARQDVLSFEAVVRSRYAGGTGVRSHAHQVGSAAGLQPAPGYLLVELSGL